MNVSLSPSSLDRRYWLRKKASPRRIKLQFNAEITLTNTKIEYDFSNDDFLLKKSRFEHSRVSG